MQHPFGPGGAAVNLADYHAALATHLVPKTTVEILTAEHDAVAGVTTELLKGAQFNFVRDGEVSRTLQLDLLDPTFALDLDSDSPNDGAVYADRFIQVTQTIESPLLATPASVIVFTGPPMQFKRNGETVSITAHGKEQRARTDVPGLVCKKNMYVVDAIEKIMRQACGERLFSLPTGVRDKIPKDVDVGRKPENQPWKVVLSLASSIGMQAFYPGTGVFTLRDPPTKSLFDFRAKSPVTKDTDWSQQYNRVDVKGKKKVHKYATAESRHPFSPTRMGRFDVDWDHTFFVEDDKIGTNKQAKRVANRKLASLIVQELKLSATAFPVWHLDPLDLGDIDGDVFQLDDASIPLTGGDMTIGDTRRIRTPTR